MFSYPDLYLIRSIYKKGEKGDTGAASTSGGSVLDLVAPFSINTTNNTWETEASFTINVTDIAIDEGDIIQLESMFYIPSAFSNPILRVRHLINGNSPNRTAYTTFHSANLEYFELGSGNYRTAKLVTNLLITSPTSLFVEQQFTETDTISTLAGASQSVFEFENNFSINNVTANNITLATEVYCPNTLTLQTNYQSIKLFKKV